MKKIKVQVKELLIRTIEIEAETEKEVEKIIKDKYKNKEIKLTDKDLKEFCIELVFSEIVDDKFTQLEFNFGGK